jgi:hypothetical protein
MKKLLILPLCFIFFVSSTIQAQSLTAESDKEAVKKVVQSAYVEGLQNEGNAEKIDTGFHPGFNLLGIGKGNQMWSLPIYNWKERALDEVKEGKKPRTGEKEVTVNFLSVDVTGTAAVVKLEFLVGGKKTYVDYLSLYKFESGWKIVNKIFYKIPEEKEPEG